MKNLEKNQPHEIYKKELGERVRILCKLFNTMDDVAAIADRSKVPIYGWMKGDADPPFSSLVRLCVAANVRIEWLASGKEPMRENDTSDDSRPLKSDLFWEIWTEVERVSLDYTKRTGNFCSPELKKAIILAIYEIVEQDPSTTKDEIVMQVYGMMIAA